MNKRKAAGLLAFALFLAAWQLFSLAAGRSYIVPSPLLTLIQMAELARSSTFLAFVSATVWRVLAALAISVPAGFFLAAAAFFGSALQNILEKAVSVIQTVPTISYLIVFLFWTGRESAVTAVCAFLVFPVVFRTVLERLKELKARYSRVWKVYPQPKHVILFQICLPEMKGCLRASLCSAFALAFKSCVMAEVLCGISQGIGKGMQAARMDLNMAGVLAWSIWLILLVFAAEALSKTLIRIFYKEQE